MHKIMFGNVQNMLAVINKFSKEGYELVAVDAKASCELIVISVSPVLGQLSTTGVSGIVGVGVKISLTPMKFVVYANTAKTTNRITTPPEIAPFLFFIFFWFS